MFIEDHSKLSEREISAFLLERYGPLLGREELAKVLGFPSVEAFDRYVQRGHLDLKLVRMPNRRGHFALGTEVAAYLVRSSLDGTTVRRKERDPER
jgi:hypothetical protein